MNRKKLTLIGGISIFVLLLSLFLVSYAVAAHQQNLLGQANGSSQVITQTTPTSTRQTTTSLAKLPAVPTATRQPTPPPAPTAVPKPTAAPQQHNTNNPALPASSTRNTMTPTENQIAQAVFQAINRSRAAAGLYALKWNPALAASARQHNLAMQVANKLSHQLPGEIDFGQRERQQGVNWTWAAENIGVTSDQSTNGALGLHQAMINEKPPEDGHRQNILTSHGTTLGVDILIDQQNNQLWLTEDFANA